MSRHLMLGFIAFAFAGYFAIPNTVMAAGLQNGDPIGVFYVTKVAGAEGDGVEVGDDLCYRCRYGTRPMAIVFVRRSSEKVIELVKTLDQLVSKHEEENFKSLVTMLGPDAGKLEDVAKDFAKTVSSKAVPITVAKDHETGPINYHIPEDAEVSVLVATDGQVVSFESMAAASIEVEKIQASVKKALEM